MIVRRLKLVNVRAIAAADFSFKPGFNLIVGVNGVGKTTVLEMLSRELAHAIKACSGVSVPPPHFEQSDIHQGSASASVSLEFALSGRELTVMEQRVMPSNLAVRPGDSPAEVDVHSAALQRRGRLKDAMREAVSTTVIGDKPTLLPELSDFRAAGRDATYRPLAVFFSTQRARPVASAAKRQRAVKASAAAYVEALMGRELQLSVYADWIHALRETSNERTEAKRLLRSLDTAVQRFMTGCIALDVSDSQPRQLRIMRTLRETFSANRLPATDRVVLTRVLRAVSEHMSNNWADPDSTPDMALKERRRVAKEYLHRYMIGYENIKGPLDQIPFALSNSDLEAEGELGSSITVERLPRWLDASQLSDGERGILALVLDLTRRLSQANPGLDDPAANASAVVLIDELEAHLHPKWQREICTHLESAFPRCQFIATTHSPQVIGEVEHNRIQVMGRGPVFSPTHSFGVDSSRVLEEIMEAPPRTAKVQEVLDRLSSSVADKNMEDASSLVDELSVMLGEDDAEVIRARVLLDFLGGEG